MCMFYFAEGKGLIFSLVMPFGFRPVSTAVHTAPAPAVVAAGVVKQISTPAIVRTLSHLLDVLGSE